MVCVYVCVNCCKKRHLCYGIYMCLGNHLSFCAFFLEGRSYGVFQRLMRGIFRTLTWIYLNGQKSLFLTYETARDTLELANNTMLYGLFPAASVGSNFTDWEPPSSDSTYARRHAQDGPACAQPNVAREFLRQPCLLLCCDSLGQHPFETRGLPSDLVQMSLSGYHRLAIIPSCKAKAGPVFAAHTCLMHFDHKCCVLHCNFVPKNVQRMIQQFSNRLTLPCNEDQKSLAVFICVCMCVCFTLENLISCWPILIWLQ